MADRWFEDVPEHDPDDPEAVERALRRQERAAKRQGKGGADGGSKKSLLSRRKAAAPDPEPEPELASVAVPEPESESEPEHVEPPTSEFVDEPLTSEEYFPDTFDDEPAVSGTSRGGGGPRLPRRSGSRGGSGRSRGRLIALGAAAVILLFVVVLFFALFQPFKGDGDGEPFRVNIPAGDSVGQVGDLLADEGVISNSTLFELNATISGKRAELYHGNHMFKKNMSYSAALEELGKQPKKVTISITIPEGLSRSETADTVEAAGLSGDYMADSVKSKALDPNDYGAGGKAKSLEGFLFPATYELKPGSTTKDLVAQQLQAFKDNIAGVNMKYAKSKNLTVYDVLTIASMVEREVAVPKERKTVAAVIYNRLEMGEPLFIDATTRFAVDNWTEPLTQSELEVDSPYNTRTNQGLPPGRSAALASHRSRQPRSRRRPTCGCTWSSPAPVVNTSSHRRSKNTTPTSPSIRKPRKRRRFAHRVLMARRLAVLGHPVSHSRSPAMQTAALEQLGLSEEWTYEAIDVPPEELADFIAGMAEAGFAGANVTVPHKEAALLAADGATPAAKAIGAANTLTVSAEGIHADNTDAPGLMNAIDAPVAGRKALLLGAGGAARAVLWALLKGGAGVAVWNRTEARAAALVAALGGSEVNEPDVSAYDLVVNASAAGLGGGGGLDELPIDPEGFRSGQTVVDMVYGTEPSTLLTAAENNGAITVDGLEILVQQGALSLEAWTGRKPSIEVMREAARG